MLLKMVLEPIWESDFLNCSNGFRLGRRTMDCIALLDSYINNRNKYYWVVRGDMELMTAFITTAQTLGTTIADQRFST